MAIDITFDAKELNEGIKRLNKAIEERSRVSIREIALEILRLSSREVPHDIGLLQTSGSVEPDLSEKDTSIVGYNKVYAARLHEHPEYNFKKGRKGKYLEDPIKMNLAIFRKIYKNSMSEAIR